MNSLSVEQLCVERDDVPLLSDVNFKLESGDIAQFAGHNGCGKTTLMRVIAGLISPSRGEVSWNGAPVQHYDFRAAMLFLGHQTGVKLTMTPIENLRWYFGINGMKSPSLASSTESEKSVAMNASDLRPLNYDKQFEEALAKVGLAKYKDFTCYQLSAGQQRRVALARLYLSLAPLWLLDEPFTAIDKEGVGELEILIEAHAARGGIIALTTHQAWVSKHIRIINLEQYSARLGATRA